MQTVADGKSVGARDSLVRPVRRPDRVDLVFVNATVELCHDRFDVRGGVVVVEQMHIDEISTQRIEGRVKVTRHVRPKLRRG